MNDLGIREILFGYICPTLGCLMATAMFAAPIHDLRDALLMGRLGCLNPLPWAFLTGNCLGWCAYGYYTHDPFILATNLPGLVLSFWLNHGAIKLQYVEYRDYRSDDMVDIQVAPIQVGMREENTRPSNTTNHLSESMILVPQEVWFFRILILWSTVLVWVGWIMPLISPSPNTWVKAATIVGLLVNLNLIFFYGAPLQSIFRVIQTKQSNSIHLMTMYMSCLNCTFWTGYGLAQADILIILPNAIGLLLGIIQGVLCSMFPRQEGGGDGAVPPQEEEVMMISTVKSTTSPTQQEQEDQRDVMIRKNEVDDPENFVPA